MHRQTFRGRHFLHVFVHILFQIIQCCHLCVGRCTNSYSNIWTNSYCCLQWKTDRNLMRQVPWLGKQTQHKVLIATGDCRFNLKNCPIYSSNRSSSARRQHYTTFYRISRNLSEGSRGGVIRPKLRNPTHLTAKEI